MPIHYTPRPRINAVPVQRPPGYVPPWKKYVDRFWKEKEVERARGSGASNETTGIGGESLLPAITLVQEDNARFEAPSRWLEVNFGTWGDEGKEDDAVAKRELMLQDMREAWKDVPENELYQPDIKTEPLPEKRPVILDGLQKVEKGESMEGKEHVDEASRLGDIDENRNVKPGLRNKTHLTKGDEEDLHANDFDKANTTKVPEKEERLVEQQLRDEARSSVPHAEPGTSTLRTKPDRPNSNSVSANKNHARKENKKDPGNNSLKKLSDISAAGPRQNSFPLPAARKASDEVVSLESGADSKSERKEKDITTSIANRPDPATVSEQRAVAFHPNNFRTNHSEFGLADDGSFTDDDENRHAKKLVTASIDRSNQPRSTKKDFPNKMGVRQKKLVPNTRSNTIQDKTSTDAKKELRSLGLTKREALDTVAKVNKDTKSNIQQEGTTDKGWNRRLNTVNRNGPDKSKVTIKQGQPGTGHPVAPAKDKEPKIIIKKKAVPEDAVKKEPKPRDGGQEVRLIDPPKMDAGSTMDPSKPGPPTDKFELSHEEIRHLPKENTGWNEVSHDRKRNSKEEKAPNERTRPKQQKKTMKNSDLKRNAFANAGESSRHSGSAKNPIYGRTSGPGSPTSSLPPNATWNGTPPTSVTSSETSKSAQVHEKTTRVIFRRPAVPLRPNRSSNVKPSTSVSGPENPSGANFPTEVNINESEIPTFQKVHYPSRKEKLLASWRNSVKREKEVDQSTNTSGLQFRVASNNSTAGKRSAEGKENPSVARLHPGTSKDQPKASGKRELKVDTDQALQQLEEHDIGARDTKSMVETGEKNVPNALSSKDQNGMETMKGDFDGHSKREKKLLAELQEKVNKIASLQKKLSGFVDLAKDIDTESLDLKSGKEDLQSADPANSQSFGKLASDGSIVDEVSPQLITEVEGNLSMLPYSPAGQLQAPTNMQKSPNTTKPRSQETDPSTKTYAAKKYQMTPALQGRCVQGPEGATGPESQDDPNQDLMTSGGSYWCPACGAHIEADLATGLGSHYRWCPAWGERTHRDRTDFIRRPGAHYPNQSVKVDPAHSGTRPLLAQKMQQNSFNPLRDGNSSHHAQVDHGAQQNQDSPMYSNRPSGGQIPSGGVNPTLSRERNLPPQVPNLINNDSRRFSDRTLLQQYPPTSYHSGHTPILAHNYRPGFNEGEFSFAPVAGTGNITYIQNQSPQMLQQPGNYYQDPSDYTLGEASQINFPEQEYKPKQFPNHTGNIQHIQRDGTSQSTLTQNTLIGSDQDHPVHMIGELVPPSSTGEFTPASDPMTDMQEAPTPYYDQTQPSFWLATHTYPDPIAQSTKAMIMEQCVRVQNYLHKEQRRLRSQNSDGYYLYKCGNSSCKGKLRITLEDNVAKSEANQEEGRVRSVLRVMNMPAGIITSIELGQLAFCENCWQEQSGEAAKKVQAEL